MAQGSTPPATVDRPPAEAAPSDTATPRSWTIEDALELYGLSGWGEGFFSINAQGNLIVRPHEDGDTLDLKELVEELLRRGIELPVLLRLTDVVGARLDQIHEAFATAIEESEYSGRFRGVYPIKVNQDRHLVERLVEFGRRHHFGLEAGSKPELLAALAMLDDPEALLICNGYKDREYVETALLASRLGRRIVLVVEKPSELDLILRCWRHTGVRPTIGLRARLASRGSGHWQESGGEGSKFGLSGRELVHAADLLAEHGLLDTCQLLHFHIGSQVSSVRALKDAVREAAWIYAHLRDMGAALVALDVGGGLGVDYDGTATDTASSMNYTLQEYANDVVYGVMTVCESAEVPVPDLITESGRATVAHHAVLVVDVLGTGAAGESDPPLEPAEEAESSLHLLWETFQEAPGEDPLETYHDAVGYRDECLNLFRFGHLTLRQRGLAEELFRAICRRLQEAVRDLEEPPEELADLGSTLAETYFCNFSLFQSLPDSWAIDQLFPVVPLHRLDERPVQRAILADITCDSDGKLARFVGPEGGDHRSLRVQPFDGTPYYLGIFLVGAYQESLGDLHNLFGDVNTVAVALDPEGGYRVEDVASGDTVTEVLEYLHYDREDLIRRVRRASEEAVRRGDMTLEESAALVKVYREGLTGYTYLEGD